MSIGIYMERHSLFTQKSNSDLKFYRTVGGTILKNNERLDIDALVEGQFLSQRAN